ncbi:MAG: hypothetical protein AB9842_07870 [Bacteroidales bacterium]
MIYDTNRMMSVKSVSVELRIPQETFLKPFDAETLILVPYKSYLVHGILKLHDFLSRSNLPVI